jgi:hypothetical protein
LRPVFPAGSARGAGPPSVGDGRMRSCL